MSASAAKITTGVLVIILLLVVTAGLGVGTYFLVKWVRDDRKAHGSPVPSPSPSPPSPSFRCDYANYRCVRDDINGTFPTKGECKEECNASPSPGPPSPAPSPVDVPYLCAGDGTCVKSTTGLGVPLASCQAVCQPPPPCESKDGRCAFLIRGANPEIPCSTDADCSGHDLCKSYDGDDCETGCYAGNCLAASVLADCCEDLHCGATTDDLASQHAYCG